MYSRMSSSVLNALASLIDICNVSIFIALIIMLIRCKCVLLFYYHHRPTRNQQLTAKLIAKAQKSLCLATSLSCYVYIMLNM